MLVLQLHCKGIISHVLIVGVCATSSELYVSIMEGARKERETAIDELSNAIRQAQKYLKSTNPSTRIVQQRMSRVQEREEAFRHAHYMYCDKANISLDNEEERNVLILEGDKALDCVDECIIFLDERERAQLAAKEDD